MSDAQKEKIRQSNLGKKHNITPQGLKVLRSNSIGGWNRGLKSSNEWKDRVRQARLGTKHSEETKLRMKLSAKIGNDNNKWLEDEVGYRALHYWIERQLGKPKICEHCGKSGRLHWANKSQKYLRDASDWLRLCPKCHKKYDKEFIVR